MVLSTSVSKANGKPSQTKARLLADCTLSIMSKHVDVLEGTSNHALLSMLRGPGAQGRHTPTARLEQQLQCRKHCPRQKPLAQKYGQSAYPSLGLVA